MNINLLKEMQRMRLKQMLREGSLINNKLTIMQKTGLFAQTQNANNSNVNFVIQRHII